MRIVQEIVGGSPLVFIQGGINIPAQESNNLVLGRSLLPMLLARTGESVCAVPITHVVEIMRPLAIETVRNMSPILEGLSIIRGSPVPVVKLSKFVGDPQSQQKDRFILLRLLERRVALVADEVLGIRELDFSLLQKLPPLLKEGHSEAISMVGVLDQQLLVVLETMRMIPAEVWASFETSRGGEQ